MIDGITSSLRRRTPGIGTTKLTRRQLTTAAASRVLRGAMRNQMHRTPGNALSSAHAHTCQAAMSVMSPTSAAVLCVSLIALKSPVHLMHAGSLTIEFAAC